jgi:hypothetical protein
MELFIVPCMFRCLPLPKFILGLTGNLKLGHEPSTLIVFVGYCAPDSFMMSVYWCWPSSCIFLEYLLRRCWPVARMMMFSQAGRGIREFCMSNLLYMDRTNIFGSNYGIMPRIVVLLLREETRLSRCSEQRANVLLHISSLMVWCGGDRERRGNEAVVFAKQTSCNLKFKKI